MSDQPRLEEQALSEALKLGLSSQLDAAEKIAVHVETDLLKMARGKVASVVVEGHGLTVKEDVRLELVELQTNQVSISPLSALLGNIKLDQPVDTTARIVLTEADINQALNSDYVKNKIPSLELNVEEKLVTIAIQFPLEMRLSDVGKIHFSGAIKLTEVDGIRSISFAAVACPCTDTQPILLETFCCDPGQGVSIPFMIALLSRLQELISRPYFQLEGVILQIKTMQVEPGSLTVEAQIRTNQIPAF